MRLTAALAWALLFATPSPGAADVVDMGPAGFTLRIEQRTTALPAAAYKAFVDGLAMWWDGVHTYSGSSKNLSIEARAGGCFCEAFPAGGGTEHARVIYVEPGKVLRMQGALGPLQSSGVASVLTWAFEPVEGGARVTLTVSTGGYLPGGFDKLAPLVDGVLKGQVTRLVAYADRQEVKAASGGR